MARADEAGGAAALSVTVVYSPRAGVVDAVVLLLREGATVADALRESGLAQRHVGIDAARVSIGVWGVLADLGDRLRDQDRVEIYRPLLVDPNEARRLRQRRQRDTIKR